MLSVRPYDGSAEDLSAFVGMVWTEAYSGRMTFPVWTPDYFRWQLDIGKSGARDMILAAYDGGTLAGILAGFNLPFRTSEGVVSGSQWSWLSVHPQFRGRGIAPALDRERRRLQRERHERLIVSYRFVGSRHSLAERPNSKTPDKVFHSTLGFWARVLDPRRFSSWHFSRWEGWMARLAGPLTRLSRTAAAGSGVQRGCAEDLPEALEVLRQSQRDAVLAVDWSPELLMRQLFGSVISQTLVLRESGRLTGLINFHLLPFQGRTREPVAILDLAAFYGASSAGRRRLMQAALVSMTEQGAVLALKLRCGDTDAWTMIRSLFVPQPPQTSLVLQWNGRPVPVPSRAPLHVLWR